MWSIQRVEINGGFLPGIAVDLPEGLTCIIGPRGSGKSTFAELVRFAICGLNGAPRARQDLVQVNLGATGLVSIITRSRRSVGYTVRRGIRQGPFILSTEGKEVGNVDLDRGTFLPLDVYTGPEIEAIADETLGTKRRSLLDDLRSDELLSIEARLADSRRSLESNSDASATLMRTLAGLVEQVEELSDSKARLASLPPAPIDRNSSELMSCNRQAQKDALERRKVESAERYLADLISSLQQVRNATSSPSVPVLAEAGSANESLSDVGSASLLAHSRAINLAVGEALRKCQEAVSDLSVTKEALSEAHRKQANRLAELQTLNQHVGEAVRERTDLEHKVRRLEELERQQISVKTQLAALSEARQSLKADFLLERDNISSLRSQTAAALQEEAGDQIRIRVLRNSDDLSYRNMLVDGLKGARVRNHDEILTELLTIRPEELSQLIRNSDSPTLDSLTKFGIERSRRILEAFNENLSPSALEIVEIDDQVKIELNVSTGTQRLFKDASELSRGQKCTALLPLLLARRESPLVIDQPEDNLDNHFIYETVVSAINRLRRRRQMIFITHNANIPVLAGADLVIVMNSDGKSGFVEKVGSVDQCKDEIVDLLEGGREAFELRRRRYA